MPRTYDIERFKHTLILSFGPQFSFCPLISSMGSRVLRIFNCWRKVNFEAETGQKIKNFSKHERASLFKKQHTWYYGKVDFLQRKGAEILMEHFLQECWIYCIYNNGWKVAKNTGYVAEVEMQGKKKDAWASLLLQWNESMLASSPM